MARWAPQCPVAHEQLLWTAASSAYESLSVPCQMTGGTIRTPSLPEPDHTEPAQPLEVRSRERRVDALVAGWRIGHGNSIPVSAADPDPVIPARARHLAGRLLGELVDRIEIEPRLLSSLAVAGVHVLERRAIGVAQPDRRGDVDAATAHRTGADLVHGAPLVGTRVQPGCAQHPGQRARRTRPAGLLGRHPLVRIPDDLLGWELVCVIERDTVGCGCPPRSRSRCRR